MRLSSLLATFIGGVSAIELTVETWDLHTAGKSVLIKFLAPWWGHCKSMKPAWDKLMEEFKDSKTSLVADVDCTAAGKPLCDKHSVQGFPTIKYGDPGELKDYQGGRDFDSLKKFASENLGPMCGPANLDLCDEKSKKQYEKFLAMSTDKLDTKIRMAVKAYEEDMPMMKKSLAHLKKSGDKKEEL